MSEKKRILIVDDNRDVLASIRRTLRRCGFDLTCVHQPSEALTLLSNNEYDLLLSDIDMPGITGHDVMKHANQAQPTMIRVFVTGAGTMDAAVRAINEGEVHRFVRKPFEAEELRDLVREALERKAELDVVAEATTRARHKRNLHEHLEAEHPGITKVNLDADGVYVVEVAGILSAAASIGLTPFVA